MRFDVFKSENNEKYYFNLKAKNGQVILASQGYTTLDAAKKGIASVKKNATDKDNFTVKQAANEKHFFNLIAGNNQVVGHSQLYASIDGANKGIASVMTNAPEAEILILEAVSRNEEE